MQHKEISDLDAALESVGTLQQKEYEKDVITYQGKINDFSELFKNHQFASNVFAFLEEEILPDVWFEKFVLSQKDGAVELSGRSDNMDTFSHQVAMFEKNEYVKSISLMNSTLGTSAEVEFNLNLSLNPKIFQYAAGKVPGPSESAEPSTNETQPAENPPAELPIQPNVK